MSEKKEMKIVFEPGCFDHVDINSQEELDDLVAQITSIFEGKTEEEIQAMSRPVDLDELMADDPEFAEILLNQLNNTDKPTLQ